ncbi:low-density lipoprotein receptor 2 isoform X2 [Patella vulgata]|nr:low-density lipoprotein receptor 2 isoform X2 [Patella vulgata]
MEIFDPSVGVNATFMERINLLGGRLSYSMDFNYRGNRIYWTDRSTKKVYSLKADGSDLDQKVILEGDLAPAIGLAYDWIHNNLYVCDTLNQILVVNPDTGARKTLLTDLHEISDVEVDPTTGWLYWIAGWGANALLMKSTLDGKNQVVISSDLDRPVSLSLDYDEQTLYWTEVSLVNRIKSIRVDGQNMTTIHRTLAGRLSSQLNYLTVSRDYIYWNQGLESIRRANKHQVTEITRYRDLESDNIPTLFMGILAIDPRKQPESPSLCGDNNGGCSHFCLTALIQSTQPYNCACPDGMNLMDDNSTCSDETLI